MVNILPTSHYKQLKLHGPLSATDHTLTSYTGNTLNVVGTVDLPCTYKSRYINATFYVVESNTQPLLSLGTSIELELIKLTYAIDSTQQNIVSDYADLFKGVGLFTGTCSIHFKENAVPVVNPPRRVPLALRDKLKDELDSMVKNDIITKVTEATDWVNSLVVIEKPKTGKLRICLDPKALNEAIRRPYYPMKTLEDVASQLSGAKYFSVLDAKSGYWSVKLNNQSSYLTTFNTPFGRYRYLRLPFGLNCSQDVFQQKIDEAIEGLPGVRLLLTTCWSQDRHN